MSTKKIILGICGSIAAYKTPDLVRKLIAMGYEVNVVMTKAAKSFVTPLSLQVTSGKIIYDDLFSDIFDNAMEHITLARWAECILIAPASANIIAKLANGLADDLLSILCLASDRPLIIAPAMNKQMWQHNATQKNVTTLINQGAIFLGPDSGLQACGENGAGRLLDPENIVDELNALFQDTSLMGKKIIITAGPTQEPIDPVRYISNRSSGKMGYALVKAATLAGAEVTLITGPTTEPIPSCHQIIYVQTAREMLAAVNDTISNQDIFIGVAAVADYRVSNVSTLKIKHNDEKLTLLLEPNVDILMHVAKNNKRVFTVGFCAETHEVERFAQEKLTKKGVNLIIVNDITKQDCGFGSDYNSVTIFSNNKRLHLEKASKQMIACQIIRFIKQEYEQVNAVSH